MARTVLVVDDDPLVLEVTADMLKDLGCEVVTAASGMDALERLSENANVDVLITDLNMPFLRDRPNSKCCYCYTWVRPAVAPTPSFFRPVESPKSASLLPLS